jgi:hypothetical protein
MNDYEICWKIEKVIGIIRNFSFLKPFKESKFFFSGIFRFIFLFWINKNRKIPDEYTWINLSSDSLLIHKIFYILIQKCVLKAKLFYKNFLSRIKIKLLRNSTRIPLSKFYSIENKITLECDY